MSGFKSKMHQFRFTLGLSLPQSPLGELKALLPAPKLYLRGLLLRGGMLGREREFAYLHIFVPSKNCRHQSCKFLLQYTQNRLWAGVGLRPRP